MKKHLNVRQIGEKGVWNRRRCRLEGENTPCIFHGPEASWQGVTAAAPTIREGELWDDCSSCLVAEVGRGTGPGSCWLCSPGVGSAFLTLLFLQPSARLGAILPHPQGWGSVLNVPQLCEPSRPAAPALRASIIAPLRFPWRVLTQVLLCQVFLTDHMPDLCPAFALPNHSHHSPACRRDTCTLWVGVDPQLVSGSATGAPWSSRYRGGRSWVRQSLMWIHWQNPGEGGREDSASQIAAVHGFSSCRGLFFFTRGFFSLCATLQAELQIHYCPL